MDDSATRVRFDPDEEEGGLRYYLDHLMMPDSSIAGGLRSWLPLHEAQEARRRKAEEAVAMTKLSAVVVMPPREQWPVLLAIKSRHMAPHVKRPPYPHITMVSPFVPEDAFEQAATRLRGALQAVSPFDIVLRRFDLLRQKKAATLILVPECEPADGLQRVFDELLRAFPECSTQAPFVAHLTVGHFEDKDEAERMREKYQDSWTELRFTVRGIHFMARTATGPFESRIAVALGKDD